MKYDTGYCTKFIAQNNLKDYLAIPMITIIKNKIAENQAWLSVQDKYK